MCSWKQTEVKQKCQCRPLASISPEETERVALVLYADSTLHCHPTPTGSEGKWRSFQNKKRHTRNYSHACWVPRWQAPQTEDHYFQTMTTMKRELHPKSDSGHSPSSDRITTLVSTSPVLPGPGIGEGEIVSEPKLVTS